VCHDSHADTWTPHFAAKHEKHRAGWTGRQAAIFVSACVGMCVERRESTCVREARYLTVRQAGLLACIER
jgi:hypothetical protein